MIQGRQRQRVRGRSRPGHVQAGNLVADLPPVNLPVLLPLASLPTARRTHQAPVFTLGTTVLEVRQNLPRRAQTTAVQQDAAAVRRSKSARRGDQADVVRRCCRIAAVDEAARVRPGRRVATTAAAAATATARSDSIAPLNGRSLPSLGHPAGSLWWRGRTEGGVSRLLHRVAALEYGRLFRGRGRRESLVRDRESWRCVLLPGMHAAVTRRRKRKRPRESRAVRTARDWYDNGGTVGDRGTGIFLPSSQKRKKKAVELHASVDTAVGSGKMSAA